MLDKERKGLNAFSGGSLLIFQGYFVEISITTTIKNYDTLSSYSSFEMIFQ